MYRFVVPFLVLFTLLSALPPDNPPACPDTLSLVRHTGYTLHYVESCEQPDWVAYDLTADEVRGHIDRADNFRADPAVRTGSATPGDYKSSGYDRGHLAPAADMKWSAVAMDESFFMSNMSPQAPSFNRGIWSRLESQVREWALKRGKLCVVTGPVLTGGPFPTIGRNKVSVPARYYKVLYDPARMEAIGFILPNERGEGSLMQFAVSVDEVEKATGIDFFPGLPDATETRVESTCNPKLWPPTPKE